MNINLKITFILLVLVVGWWAYGFTSAILDQRANVSLTEMTAKMEKLDPIRKSGYRTYKANFTEDSKTASDIQKKKRTLDELTQ